MGLSSSRGVPICWQNASNGRSAIVRRSRKCALRRVRARNSFIGTGFGKAWSTPFSALRPRRKTVHGSSPNMFEALLWSVFVVVLIGIVSALDGSRDVFHPLVFIGPMLAFIYGWMPLRLLSEDGLSRFFDNDQLLFVQALNIAGIVAFIGACLAAGCRVKRREAEAPVLSTQGCWRLKLGGAAVGGVGLLCWLISIVNVGGFVNAFSRSYSGGWDDSGYIRDGSLLLLVGVLLVVAVIT